MTGVTFNGSVTFNGPMFDIHDNQQVTIVNGVAHEQAAEERVALTVEKLGEAVAGVQGYVWGHSSYAVLFCVCRDEYGWADNASLFERQLSLTGIDIPAGTLNAAISRNSYMRLPVSKWKELGVKDRVLILMDRFREVVGMLTTKA